MTDIPEAALSWTWLRAGGPGGQHQNKTETAVQLRYSIPLGDLNRETAERLRRLAGSRLNSADEIIIECREHRSREMNRRGALEKLELLIQEAEKRDIPRKKTRPTRASSTRRVQLKKENSQKKMMRKKPDFTGE